MSRSMLKKGKVFLFFLLLFGLTACGGAEEKEAVQKSDISWDALVFDRSTELEYAEKFSIHHTEDGYALLSVEQEGDFLIVPKGKEIPSDLPADITVLQQPLENIYLAATSAMDYFCRLDAMDALRFSGTQADSWYIEEAKTAMEQEDILYAGKYSAPDYEKILAEDCGLAIESTMIYHSPEVKENMEGFGIPVFVDRSSYEPHPLGRTEWVKVYGVLLGKEDAAEELMAEQSEHLKSIEEAEKTGKKVGFFYVSSRGYVNVRKSGDYVSKMIELAGGEYLFSNLGTEDTALSTMNLQMEEFYAAARDADILIYNSTIDGALTSKKDFLEQCPLLADSKAVQNGEIWCTTQNMFQETMSIGDMIQELSMVIHGEEGKLEYLYRLQ